MGDKKGATRLKGPCGPKEATGFRDKESTKQDSERARWVNKDLLAPVRASSDTHSREACPRLTFTMPDNDRVGWVG